MTTQRTTKDAPAGKDRRDATLAAKLAAVRFNWQGRTTAPAVMDALLDPAAPFMLFGYRDALLPLCVRLLSELWPDDELEIRYKFWRSTKDDDAGPSASDGFIVSALKIGAWGREDALPSPLIALANLRGLLASLSELDLSNPRVRAAAHLEALRWFRFAFEIPYLWDAGYRRRQGDNSRDDRVRNFIREKRGTHSRADAVKLAAAKFDITVRMASKHATAAGWPGQRRAEPAG